MQQRSLEAKDVNNGELAKAMESFVRIQENQLQYPN